MIPTLILRRVIIHQSRRKTIFQCNNNSANNNPIMQKKMHNKHSSTKTEQSSPANSDMIDKIKSFSIGSFAGLMGSLAGMGGGFVMIPLMTAAARTTTTNSGGILSKVGGGLGLSQHQAHGTSLFAVGTTGLAGALGYGINVSRNNTTDESMSLDSNDEEGIDDVNPKPQQQQQQLTSSNANDNETTSLDINKEDIIDAHTKKSKQQQGMVELDLALALTATAMITARFGAIASSKLSERALQRALGAFMMFVAPLVPAKGYLQQAQGTKQDMITTKQQLQPDDEKDRHIPTTQFERLFPASIIGCFSGFLAGVFGVGGGAIVVPALVLSTDMPYHSALGTSLCAMVLPAMVGSYTHSLKGNVNWRVAPFLAAGSAVGAFLGAEKVGLNMDEGILRAGFSCLMLVLGVRTWRKGSLR